MLLAELIGDSAGIAAVRDQVARLVGRRGEVGRLPPVLLQGETGTGKGLVARALHLASGRRDGPFVDVNCAAIPEPLLETEMFGVERGAFTGADRARAGLFQAAHRGTLFLDEIGLIPEAVQIKLLKAIEERTVRRLGRTASEPVDVWVLAATSEDLDEAMRTRRFRRDLYHRLAVVTLRLPPLRDRGADVDLLAEHFLARLCADYGVPRKTLSAEARTALRSYGWPGNIRELSNVIERAVLLSDRAVLTAEALELGCRPDMGAPEPAPRHDGGALRQMLESTERERVVEALQRANWNLSRAAAWLRLPRNTLRYRMERLGLRSSPPSRRREGPPQAPAPSSLSPARPRTAAAAAGNQRRLTWLRADLIGGGSAASEFDTSRALEIITEKVHGFGGEVEKLDRTRVVAVFGLEPIEDAPRRAALTAVAVQKAADRARRAGAWPWAVTIGIHVHDCVLAPVGSEAAIEATSTQVADDVLEALAGTVAADSIVISEAAARFLDRRFDLAPAPLAEGAAPAMYRLMASERTGFGLSERVTAFVGRQEELALLESRLASALSGRGHVVAIIGEPGIGKSRLLFEFRRRLRRDAVTYLEGRCLSYGGAIPYLPVLEILRQACGITGTDEADTVTDKVRSVLGKLGVNAAAHEPYLLQLFDVKKAAEWLRDVNPESRKVRTFEALRSLALAASRSRPLVLAVEDLHWIDKTSDEVLAALVASLHGAPILLVATYRPGYQPPWLARPHVTQMALPPLSSGDSIAVLRSALRSDDIAPQVAEQVLARAEGNPFFLEELARAIGDDMELAADAVPDTVHSVLTARIDRLSPADRRLLQTAAVVGKDVPINLLQAIVPDDSATLPARLRQLQTADFLLETRLAPELEYTFKHALTHEVAYGTLTRDERRRLHANVARALARAWPEMPEQRPEVVARHLTAAELPAEAIPFWLRAGQQAMQRSANVEAISHLRTALDLLRTTPDSPERDLQELELQVTLGRALIMTMGFAAAEVEDAYGRARALCHRLGETPKLFEASRGLFIYQLVRGDLRSAEETGEQLLVIAHNAGNARWLARAYGSLGASLFYRGRFGEARSHLEESIAPHQPGGAAVHGISEGHAPPIESLGFLGWIMALQGHEAEALRYLDAARQQAEKLGDAFSRASALNFAGLYYAMRRDFAAVRECTEREIAIAHEHCFPHLLGVGIWLRGLVLASDGRHEEGLKLMSEGLATLMASGGLAITFYLSNIAETHLVAGNVERGLTAVAEGLVAAERNDERFYEPELHRIRGELLASGSATSREAKASLKRAVSLARCQGSRVLARRAAESFATYLRARGRAPEAEQMLAELAEESRLAAGSGPLNPGDGVTH